MNAEDPKFRHRPAAVSQNETQQRHAASGSEFKTPEELLRWDQAQTQPPASLPERLEASLSNLKPPRASWWKRLFGRK